MDESTQQQSPNRAGPPMVAPAGPKAEDWLERVRRDSPSWGGSFFFHALILVAIVLIGAGVPRGDGSGLGFELSGGDGREAGGGDGGSELAALEESPSASTTWTSVAELEPQPVETPTEPLVSTLDVSDPFAATPSSSPGTGGGTGSTSGPGDGAGLGSGLSPIRTGVFGLVEEASSFVYVFDRSESMNSVLTYSSEGANVVTITPLMAAKAELLRSLGDLNARQRFQIVFYNDQVLPFSDDRLLAADEANLRKAAQFIERTPGEGGTFHLEPLKLALTMRPEAIFLMTDGQAKDDPTPVELKEIRDLNRRRTKINVVHFCFIPREAGPLQELASENGGRFISINISQLGPGLQAQAGR